MSGPSVGLRELRRLFYQLEEAGKIDRETLVLRAWEIATEKQVDPRAALASIGLIWERWFGKEPTPLVGKDGENLFGTPQPEEIDKYLERRGLRLVRIVPPPETDKSVN